MLKTPQNKPPKFADLHLHTNFSDSTTSPEEIVDLAIKIGFSAISICDHDSVSGLKDAFKKAENTSLEIIPGIELSCEKNNSEVHILGYFIDWKNVAFEATLKGLRDARINRAEKILNKLKKYNIYLDIEELLNMSKSEAVGRLHIATLLFEKGYVKTKEEAFKKFIGDKGPCYISGFKLTPLEGIKLIKKYGGIPVIAHPYLIEDESYLEELVKLGIEGIEVMHSDHSHQDARLYANFAKIHNLLITGGSDDHGKAKKKALIGTVKLPYKYVECLKEKIKIADYQAQKTN